MTSTTWAEGVHGLADKFMNHHFQAARVELDTRGVAITLLTKDNWRPARDFISILEEAKQEVPTGLRAMADRFDAWKKRQAKEKHSFGIECGSGFRQGRRGGGCVPNHKLQNISRF
ncbi:hypothetical protein MRX96_002201 [Rhipicephalus microplus]